MDGSSARSGSASDLSELLHEGSHVSALVLGKGKLCLAGLPAAVASKDSSTVGAASSDVIHVEHARAEGIADWDEEHPVVHQLGDRRPTAVNNQSIYGQSVKDKQSE